MGYYNNNKILTVFKYTAPDQILPDVKIERVWLSYDEDTYFVPFNFLVGKDKDGNSVINDATKIYINFKTSAITDSIEDEIEAGRFVIRFDYPVRFKNNKFRLPYWGGETAEDSDSAYTDVQYAKKVKGGHPSGHGARSFTHNFSEMDETKANFLINSLIFITSDDVKTDEYGEKYIFKQLTFLELMNKLWKDNSEDALSLTEVSDEYKEHIIEHFADEFLAGIPQNYWTGSPQYLGVIGNTSVPNKLSSSRMLANYLLGIHTDNNDALSSSPKYTYDLMYNVYAPLEIAKNLENIDATDVKNYLSSRFLKNKGICSGCTFSNHSYSTYNKQYYTIVAKNSKLSLVHFKTAIKPRCCIIDENYATKTVEEGSIWLKKFSLCEQGIYSTFRTIIYSDDETLSASTVPVFNLKITPIKTK